MYNIDKLLPIADNLGLSNILIELETIEKRSKQENATIMLPLVGEFSSGKTTLINALTDSKKLETATQPTTATIYEVHFGCPSCCANVVYKDGSTKEIKNIEDLKNDGLADAKVVTVFDTSKLVPSSTIIVDTPGLSSPNPEHKQTLVNFLPKADGILLATDINQQITRSLTDFIETMKLSMRPIFLILTKSDTKSQQDIESVKTYISDNCKIPIQQMAVVSASTNKLSEFYDLLNNIQKDKKKIIQQVDAKRVKNIVSLLQEHVDELLGASNSDKEMDESIRRSQYELEKITRNIDRLVESISVDVEERKRTVSRKFEDTISTKLNGLINNKSNNYDSEAVSMINSVSALLMNEYKTEVQHILCDKAQSRKNSEDDAYLGSIRNVNLSDIQMSGLSYSLNLNTMGHEYDGWIKTGVIAVTAGAAVVTGAAMATSGTIASNVIDVADTVSDVSSIVSNQKTANRIEKATSQSNVVSNNNQQPANNKGMIDSMIGFVTDKLVSKPQRVRAIRNYIDTSLAPSFSAGLTNITRQIVSDIHTRLESEASQIIEQKEKSLNQLKKQQKEQKEVFEQRMNQLREYKTELLTL